MDILIIDNFICRSKTEALRKIKFHSLLLNMNPFSSDYVITKKDFLHKHFILIKKGKKNFAWNKNKNKIVYTSLIDNKNIKKLEDCTMPSGGFKFIFFKIYGS